MSASTVTIELLWAQALALLGLIRQTPASVVGAAARQEVVELIVALEKKMPKPFAGDRMQALKWGVLLELNREHLGAVKLALIELWTAQGSTGATIEQIVDVARVLRIWTKHVQPALPKSVAPALLELDGESPLDDLDEVPSNAG